MTLLSGGQPPAGFRTTRCGRTAAVPFSIGSPVIALSICLKQSVNYRQVRHDRNKAARSGAGWDKGQETVDRHHGSRCF
ncbi:MAG: hypothetical protein ACREX0_14550 [Noviherbaspirillum sp.]